MKSLGLYSILMLATGALGQQPDTLLHSIPAPPTGAQSGVQLGHAVTVDGAYTVVGAPFDSLGAGSSGVVKVFDSSSGAVLFVIPNPSPALNEQFGSSVAISGTRLVVGARNEDTGGNLAGSAHVYDLTSGTPTVPVLTLNNPAPASGDHFGYSVAISGTRVVVGEPNNSVSGFGAGSVHIYDLNGGTPTVPVHSISNPTPAAGDSFGWSVALSGTLVVIGAKGDQTGAFEAGSAYVYDLSSGTPTVPVYTLNNPGPAMGDLFGWSVAISGTRLVVGAHGDQTGGKSAGIAYVYDLSGGNPTLPLHTLNSPAPSEGDSFGWSAAISGNMVVVGAPGDGQSGSGYVYDMSSGTPTVPLHTIINPAPAASDSFGSSVSISDHRVLIGAPKDDAGATDSGSVYAYDLASGTPTMPVATLTNPTPGSGDEFGRSVAISGVIATIGAPYDDTVVKDKGYAYVYSPVSGTSPPNLSAPADSATTSSPISVIFTLPEAALAGSVKLAFGATQLTLASSVETAGTHSFTFNPGNPTSSPQIVSGGSIVDGTYTVTLSYQDALGNPVASVSSTHVTVDTTAPSGGSMTLTASSPVVTSSGIAVTFAGWDDASPPLQYEVLIDDVITSAQGTSASRNLTAPATPGSYTLKGRIYDALGNMAETTQSIEVESSPQQRFDNAMTAAGLAGPDAQATAMPRGDGVANLLKYAFNMDLTMPDCRTLVPGSGVAGLPVFTMPSPGVIRIEYLRRVGSGLIYTPEKSAALDAEPWLPLTAPPQLTPINATWERVHHDESFDPMTAAAMFYRVEVELP